MKEIVVFCADVGSIKTKNFGWAYGLGIPGRGWKVYPEREERKYQEIEKLKESVRKFLEKGYKVALGFECPLFVPLRKNPLELTSARKLEPMAWSASAGAGALAVGMVEALWLLKALKNEFNTLPPVYLSWEEFKKESLPCILFWEAMVSKDKKGKTHVEDAKNGVNAFFEKVETAQPVCEEEVFSLIGSYLLRSGWSKKLELLKTPCIFISA